MRHTFERTCPIFFYLLAMGPWDRSSEEHALKLTLCVRTWYTLESSALIFLLAGHETNFSEVHDMKILSLVVFFYAYPFSPVSVCVMIFAEKCSRIFFPVAFVGPDHGPLPKMGVDFGQNPFFIIFQTELSKSDESVFNVTILLYMQHTLKKCLITVSYTHLTLPTILLV